jgi:hypothetical protein
VAVFFFFFFFFAVLGTLFFAADCSICLI